MDVAVVGAAMTQFGERDAGLQSLLAEAGEQCLADGGVEPAAIDRLTVARASGNYTGQAGLANLVAGDLGVRPAAASAIDQTSAAGGAGLFQAWRSVASGASEMTLLVGGEKMTHLTTAEVTDPISAITHPAEYKHGVTLPSFAGLTARAYLDRFDVPREALARVAVKNHEHGVDNPNAQFQREIDVATALDSPMVADPLRLYDFCPISDGSAAALVTTAQRASELTDDYALLAGVAGATDTHVVHERPDSTRLRAARLAAQRAYDRAGIGPEDVDVAELHDMFTILECLQMEAVGFADHGEAWRAVQAGQTHREGGLPINTSGGLKSKGHPLSASGVAQAVELYEQLTDTAGPRQVDADFGLACNIGGFGNCAVTSILRRP